MYRRITRLFLPIGLRALIGISLVTSLSANAAELLRLDEETPVLSGRLTASESWPGGDVALLLHGTLSHRDTEIIQSLETLLPEQGVSTLAINLSLGVDDRQTAFPCDSAHRHREQDAIVELSRWVDWLSQQGAQDLTLIGHSRGANQVARYVHASADPRVARMILLAPPQWNAENAATSYEARHGKPLAPLIARAEQQVAAGQPDKLLPQRLGLLYCDNTQATAETFVSYYANDPLRDTPTLLGLLETPTLVIAGSKDDIAEGLPAAMAERAPHIELEEIDGADHFFRDLYAYDLVDIAVEFMDQTSNGISP